MPSPGPRRLWRLFRQGCEEERAARPDPLARWKELWAVSAVAALGAQLLHTATSWSWPLALLYVAAVPYAVATLVVVATWLTRWGNGGR